MYRDGYTGDELSESELESRFNDFLEDTHPERIVIAGLEFSPSEILKKVDQIAYRETYLNWLNGEIEDGIVTEDEEEDD